MPAHTSTWLSNHRPDSENMHQKSISVQLMLHGCQSREVYVLLKYVLPTSRASSIWSYAANTCVTSEGIPGGLYLFSFGLLPVRTDKQSQEPALQAWFGIMSSHHGW
ncbi:hypothetical protein J1614_010486 [Plenodomus biglobosus]|nr:hypothetical protein J1614_010486 [Plenodomus biglobosus]